jgi:hypothetical protein
LRSLVLGFLFALSLSTAWSKDFCSYKNTNQLSWDPQFPDAIRSFFGELRDTQFSAGQKVAEQALERLGGPPEDLKSLPDGLALAAACKAHSCPEEGATVISCPSTIVAVAIVRYSQQCDAEAPGEHCKLRPTVTMFFRDAKAMVGREALEQWITARPINWGEVPPPPVTLEYRAADGTTIRPPDVIPGRARPKIRTSHHDSAHHRLPGALRAAGAQRGCVA